MHRRAWPIYGTSGQQLPVKSFDTGAAPCGLPVSLSASTPSSTHSCNNGASIQRVAAQFNFEILEPMTAARHCRGPTVYAKPPKSSKGITFLVLPSSKFAAPINVSRIKPLLVSTTGLLPQTWAGKQADSCHKKHQQAGSDCRARPPSTPRLSPRC